MAHPITAAQPSFRRHVRSHCTAALAIFLALAPPSPAAADDSTERFGPSATAEVGLPFRVVPGERPSTTGSARPDLLARVGLHSGPRSDPFVPDSVHLTPSRSGRLGGMGQDAETILRACPTRTPTTREGLRSDCTDPVPTARPDPSPCPPHGSRPDDSAHDRASDGVLPLRPIDSGRSFRPGLSVSGTRPKAPWRSARLTSRSRRRWGSPASTTGHRRRSDGPGGLSRLAFQPAGGRSVQIRTGPRRGGRRRCDRKARARGAAGGGLLSGPASPAGLPLRGAPHPRTGCHVRHHGTRPLTRSAVTTPTRPTRTASAIRAARTIHIPSQPNALPTARPGLHPPSLQLSTPPLPRNAPFSAALVSVANLPGSAWPARRSERRAARPSGVGPCPPAAAWCDRTASCRPRPGVGSALPASSVTRRGANVGSAGSAGSDQRRGGVMSSSVGAAPGGWLGPDWTSSSN